MYNLNEFIFALWWQNLALVSCIRLHFKVPSLLSHCTRSLSTAWTWFGQNVRGAAKGLILCGDMEGVAQYSQSHISKLNSRWTALGKVLWDRCGWWQTGSQWDSWRPLSPAGLVASWSSTRWGWPWSELAYRGLSMPLTTSDTLIHMSSVMWSC